VVLATLNAVVATRVGPTGLVHDSRTLISAAPDTFDARLTSP